MRSSGPTAIMGPCAGGGLGGFGGGDSGGNGGGGAGGGDGSAAQQLFDLAALEDEADEDEFEDDEEDMEEEDEEEEGDEGGDGDEAAADEARDSPLGSFSRASCSSAAALPRHHVSSFSSGALIWGSVLMLPEPAPAPRPDIYVPHRYLGSRGDDGQRRWRRR